MNSILVIAKNTLRETIRDRMLYGIVGFALLYLLFTLFLGELSLGNEIMIKSFGLAGIYLFGLIVTVFLGASIIDKEIERRTLYFVLPKPVRRAHVIMGKFLGLLMAVALTILLMAAVYFAVIIGAAHLPFHAAELLALLLQVCEMALLIAMLIFFSALVRPIIATLAAVLILIVGHLMGAVLNSAQQIGGLTLQLIKVLYYALPNLEKFNIRNAILHQVTPSGEVLLVTLGYAVLYTALFLLAARFIFDRREL